MKHFFALFLLTASLTGHATCRFDIQPKDVTVKWQAYKTPKKVAVQGEFKKFSFRATRAADVFTTLSGATFQVDSSSVSTGNPQRDKKIVQNFFSHNGKKLKIVGKFSAATNATATAMLELQGVSKTVVFSVDQLADKLRLTADINVLDFSLQDNLSRINLACKALHEGVTWPDVKIMLEIGGKKRCN